MEERWNMALTLSRTLSVHVAWLSLWPLILFAGAPDPEANLRACKNGWAPCDRSRLTLSELTEVARAGHLRNASDCRAELVSCDPSRLTPPEAIALAVARYDRNVSDCRDGIRTCDASRLTRRESGESAAAGPRPVPAGTDGNGASDASTVEVDITAHARNMAACTGGRETCDYSVLSASESATLAAAEHLRNYTACVNGRGYCDRSRLTPAEAAATPAGPGVASSVGRQP